MVTRMLQIKAIEHGRCSIAFFLLALILPLLPACKPKEIQALLGPSEALMSVVTEEAVTFAGPKKQVALITHDTSWGPPSTAEETLKRNLKTKGLSVVTVKTANLGNPMLSGIVGLKGADFIEAMEKSVESGVVISLVGAPLLAPEDTKRIAPGHPPVLVVATAMLGDKLGVRGEPLLLARLLDARVIQMAIIDGAASVSNTVGKSNPTRELFDKNYQILRQPQ
jgi:hypothetical protein